MLFRLAGVLSIVSSFFPISAATFPSLTYSTYLREGFTPKAIATDNAGNVYLAGNAAVGRSTSQSAVLVVKLDRNTGEYVYSRYIGGSINDYANAIAVDAAGNAYIAGVTTSPDFPVTRSGDFATPPSTGTERSFVAKLNPSGDLVFSALLGGSANSYSQAVAVNRSGQILVTGTSVSSGFPSTPGVYTASDTTFVPYLVELDPSAGKIVFSATGVGGSAIALDSSGNIFVAGTTGSLTYPTTPGSFQPAFPAFQTCLAPCHGSFQGPNQYVTKLDPTGTKLLFSTAVSGTGNTLNQGLAVDSRGNVYLTGLAGAGYPFTVDTPSAPLAPALTVLATPALPFLTKLDAAGQKLLYSVPVGGAGLAVDSDGLAYAGGIRGLMANYDVVAALPALASVPAPCLLPELTRGQSAYVSQVDAGGNVLGTQFIGGSTLGISGVALSGKTFWITGTTSLPDFPLGPGAVTGLNLKPAPAAGAYVGAVDFAGSQPVAGTPQAGCVVDSADLKPAGPVTPYQLVTIFGTGLGPSQPEIAGDTSTTTLGGVTVTFDGHPATLLYVSSNQINLAVPLVSLSPSGTLMQVTVDGSSSRAMRMALTTEIPKLFVATPSPNLNTGAPVVMAINADGTANSPANPASLGSGISVFVNGLSLYSVLAVTPPVPYAAGPWAVTGFSQANPFVLKVDLRVPSSADTFLCQVPGTPACAATFTIYDLASYFAGSQPGGTGGLSFGGTIFVNP